MYRYMYIYIYIYIYVYIYIYIYIGGGETGRKIMQADSEQACMYVCTDSAALAHARTRLHRLAAPRQSSGMSQTPHPTACPQACRQG